MNKDMESKLYMFMSAKEEREYFNNVCDRIIKNPRFYLDNLETLNVFRVSFNTYKKEKAKIYK